MAAESRAAVLRRYLKGRTIKEIDARAVNVLRLKLDNGMVLDLEVEAMGNQIYGIVPCLCQNKSDHMPSKNNKASRDKKTGRKP